MTVGYDAAVIGAGLVGAACAEALARTGRSVLVLDRGPAASGATAAGMGHVVVMDDSPAQLALTRRGRELWDQRRDAWPLDTDFSTCGTCWVASDEEEMEAVRRKQALYREAGVACSVEEAAGLATLEPALRTGLAGALRVPGDRVVYPPPVTRYLLRHKNITLRSQAEVQECSADGPILAGGEWIPARLTVNAAGAEAARLMPQLPIRSRKGHLAVTDRYPGLVRHQLIELDYLKKTRGSEERSVAFNVQPRPNGQLLVGSSRQYNAEDRSVDPVLLGRMLRKASTYLPGLAALSVLRVWTGLRAATPDSLPLIGPLPGQDRLWVAAGHEGLGITTALVTAEILIALLEDGRPPINPRPYSADRFPGKVAS